MPISHLHNRIPHSNNRTLAPATHTHSRLATRPTTISPAIPYMPLLRPSPTPTPTPAPRTTTITHPTLDSPSTRQLPPSSTPRVSLAAPVCMYEKHPIRPFQTSEFLFQFHLRFPFPFRSRVLTSAPEKPSQNLRSLRPNGPNPYTSLYTTFHTFIVSNTTLGGYETF